jgi:hypothetical protein
MNTLVVLTDLGNFKAFSMEQDRVSSTPRLQPVQTMEMEEGDDRVGRKVSDQAGQFHKSGPVYGSSYGQASGERHNICLENERRSVKEIAQKISELLSDGKFDSCYFAAPSDINKTILDHLEPQARAKIEKNVQCDLVNARKDEILNHFNN